MKTTDKKTALQANWLKYLLILVVVAIFGIILSCVQYFKTDKIDRNASITIEFAYDGAYKNISSPEKDNISVEARIEQSFSDFRDHNMAVDISKTVANDSVKKNRNKKNKKTQVEKCK